MYKSSRVAYDGTTEPTKGLDLIRQTITTTGRPATIEQAITNAHEIVRLARAGGADIRFEVLDHARLDRRGWLRPRPTASRATVEIVASRRRACALLANAFVGDATATA